MRVYLVLIESITNTPIDVEARGWKGRTALHHAARYGHVSVAKILLEKSDVEARDIMVKVYSVTFGSEVRASRSDEVVGELGGS